MSLVVPTSRASILRPLNESVDFDENPDTPGTTYSFQDQSSKPMNMQTGTVPHLSVAMMDASMLISTDDEMLDSDSDQRRDEDYDIDVDAEVYSVNGGDLEVTMTMEEDIVAYGRLEQDDNDDDIMLDDDPTDYGDGYDVHHGGHNIIATQTDTQLDVNSSMAPTMSQQETSFFQQLSPHQSNFNRQDPEASSSQPVLTQSDIGAAMTETQTTQPDNGGNRGDGEPVDVDPQQEQEQVPQQQPSPVSHQDIPSQSNILLEEEENDGTQSSTATLAHEVVRNDEQTAEENNDNTPVPKYQSQQELESSDADAGPVGTEDPFDSLYQHPVIVQYEQNQLTLFPSMADWSNDPVLANVYSDVPSDYLLPDVGVCEKTLSDLFMHLRDVLGPAVGLGSELVVEIELLGLKMGEVSPPHAPIVAWIMLTRLLRIMRLVSLSVCDEFLICTINCRKMMVTRSRCLSLCPCTRSPNFLVACRKSPTWCKKGRVSRNA